MSRLGDALIKNLTERVDQWDYTAGVGSYAVNKSVGTSGVVLKAAEIPELLHPIYRKFVEESDITGINEALKKVDAPDDLDAETQLIDALNA